MKVAFDVDDTLIVWGINSEGNEICVPNWTVLETLRNWHAIPTGKEDLEIFVWSGGGADYAERWGRWLHLDLYRRVSFHAKSPNLGVLHCYDDEPEYGEITLAPYVHRVTNQESIRREFGLTQV